MKCCLIHKWKISNQVTKVGRRSADIGLGIQSLLCVKCGKMKVKLVRTK